METNKSRERTVDDVLEEALRYRGFWGEKGESLSVEEPSLQIDFLIALLPRLKSWAFIVLWIPVLFLSGIRLVIWKKFDRF